MSDLIPKINSAIKYSFYAIFFLVPLAMWPDTYELFEFNKMWVVFIMSVFIFFLWSAKMVIEGRIRIRRTPLDIPIALFVAAHIISTFLSMDVHTSIWGYYSRFNGGLLSILSYIFLYYAFATNLIPEEKTEKDNPASYKILFVAFLSGVIVTLWGLPSHYGYDPTCYVFRGELNVNCWTEQFHPTLRIFSTLGQPNWMGTFLAVLLPISVGFGLAKLRTESKNKTPLLMAGLFLAASLAFYISILWTRSQSSFLGLLVGMILFTVLFILSKGNIGEIPGKIIKDRSLRILAVVIVLFLTITFFIGSPVAGLNKYFSASALTQMTKSNPGSSEAPTETQSFASDDTIRIGGTASSDIRLIVWQGGLELFKKNPLFGTGVETYAYAYYSVKPLAHNLTSEWDYLYNKAHNEYLNYLATTGFFGFLSYMLFIGFFYFYAGKSFIKTKNPEMRPITIGIVSGITALLVSNFFGFSVVIINLFLFILPIFFFELEKSKEINKFITIPANTEELSGEKLGTGRMTILIVIGIISSLILLHLVNFWFADRTYALGYNLNKAGEYVRANPYLNEAVNKLPGEDLYKDELSINLATLAILSAQQNQTQQASEFARRALELSDGVLERHPNNIVYLKTRARVGFALAQLDPTFIDMAIQTVEKAKRLAPTDAKLSYNLGLFYNQKGDFDNTIKYMVEAIELKPNYSDPYYALALLYSQLAEEEPAKAAEYKQKARENAEYILDNIDANNVPVKELLETL